jgi:Ca2+-binding EF-hand superfamily protein
MLCRACLTVAICAAAFPLVTFAQMNTATATANFHSIDTDHDAKLDRHELLTAAGRDFDRLDIDHDGYLTHRELYETRNRSLLLPFPGRFESSAAFAAADTDRDMKIDKHEYETAVVEAYMKCDRNRDETIELSDLRHCSR